MSVVRNLSLSLRRMPPNLALQRTRPTATVSGIMRLTLGGPVY
jgi:hypothetical protein